MNVDSKGFWDSIFLSYTYNKILKRLYASGITTTHGKEISHMDLRKAIDVMVEKHPTYRGRSEKIRSRKYFVLVEGYYCLTQVYFQKEKSFIDPDIDFFKLKIKQYEALLKIENDENWGNEDMNIKQLCEYLDRKDITVRKAIKKMCDSGVEEYKFLVDNKVVISKEGVEWICKNVFKQKVFGIVGTI